MTPLTRWDDHDRGADIGRTTFSPARCLYCDGPLTNLRDIQHGAHTAKQDGYSCYVRAQEMAS